MMQLNRRLDYKTFLDLLKETYAAWNRDKVPRLGAALAFYTVFSLSPLLLILIAMAGFFLGPHIAEHRIEEQIRAVVGGAAAQAILGIIQNAHRAGGGVLATLIGLGTAAAGAAGFFGQLQDALNTIWGVQPKPNLGIGFMIRQRLVSFLMVIGTGILLLASFLVSTALSVLNRQVSAVLPTPGWTTELASLLVSLVVFTLLFAMLYRTLPDATVAWRDVWVGSALTSVLFAIGKWGIGLYLAHSGGSAIQAGGTLMVLLLWFYYVAQILFFGAEFTQVYASKCGSTIVPAPYAEPLGTVMAPLAPPSLPLTAAISAMPDGSAVVKDVESTGAIQSLLTGLLAFAVTSLVLSRLRARH